MSGILTINDHRRSELARDEPESAAGYQVSSVIVDDHRELARSYRSSPALINPSLNCKAANRAYSALLAISS